jgi:hypothetical protein
MEFVENDNLKFNYLNTGKLHDIIPYFYDLIITSDKYVKSKKQTNCFKYSIKKINNINDIPKSSMHDSYFFPDTIQNHIDDYSLEAINFKCNINQREINVNFILFETITHEKILELNKKINMIYMWIYILDSFATLKCTKILNLYVYMTPFKKQLPDNQLIVIGPNHVNTGFTTSCQLSTDIILYRQEEWFKVFIHETFHNFGLDFSDMNLSSINSDLRKIFNVNIEYNLYETYCESWARIINCMFYSYLSMSKNNINNFTNVFIYNMTVECEHSLEQMIKILKFFDINFEIITNKNKENITICNHLYKENSSVFSYYVITALIINNYDNFMLWCNKNNNSFLKFKRTPGNIDKYINFIKKTSKTTHILKNINIIETSDISSSNKNTSLKMSNLNVIKII